MTTEMSIEQKQQNKILTLQICLATLGMLLFIVLAAWVLDSNAKEAQASTPKEIGTWMAEAIMNHLEPKTSFVWMDDTECIHELPAGIYSYPQGTMTWSDPIPLPGDLSYMNNWNVTIKIGNEVYYLVVADNTDGCDFVRLASMTSG